MALTIQSTTITPNPVTIGQSFILSVKVESTQTTYADLTSYTYGQVDSGGKTYAMLETAEPVVGGNTYSRLESYTYQQLKDSGEMYYQLRSKLP